MVWPGLFLWVLALVALAVALDLPVMAATLVALPALAWLCERIHRSRTGAVSRRR